MPFTFSHPAIILPLSGLKKKLFSLTGLIAGSMVPDFEFLLRLRDTDDFAHAWPGIFLFGLPFSILLSFVFHLVIRNPLILHLPAGTRQRFTILLSFNWKKYFRKNIAQFFMSVMLGIGSHIFVDAFTHADGIFVLGNAFFNKELFTVMKYNVPVYFILQLLTSLVGAVYILWYVSKMKRGTDIYDIKIDYYGYWISLVLVGALILLMRLLVYPQYLSADDIINAIVGSYVFSLMIVSVFYTSYANKRKEKKAPR